MLLGKRFYKNMCSIPIHKKQIKYMKQNETKFLNSNKIIIYNYIYNIIIYYNFV